MQQQNFEFNSKVCTDVEQSRRLMKLGLKTETSDMHGTNMSLKGKNYQDDWTFGAMPYNEVKEGWEKYAKDSCWELIPTWSLNRLIELAFPKGVGIVSVKNTYDNIISLIEKRINNGIFNENYLNV